MTNDELRRTSQRIADARARRRGDITADARPPASPTRGAAAPFVAGDRVFDVRRGVEGEVADRGLASRAGAGQVDVIFTDGTTGLSAVADLLARPRPPAGRG